ncbi:hypothetical protein CPC08DRAFT_24736 [Agrocybe pediades]|nr:hypothetical protein CPC08DRAFT_24736 [Agrocybe pediades]
MYNGWNSAPHGHNQHAIFSNTQSIINAAAPSTSAHQQPFLPFSQSSVQEQQIQSNVPDPSIPPTQHPIFQFDQQFAGQGQQEPINVADPSPSAPQQQLDQPALQEEQQSAVNVDGPSSSEPQLSQPDKPAVQEPEYVFDRVSNTGHAFPYFGTPPKRPTQRDYIPDSIGILLAGHVKKKSKVVKTAAFGKHWDAFGRWRSVPPPPKSRIQFDGHLSYQFRLREYQLEQERAKQSQSPQPPKFDTYGRTPVYLEVLTLASDIKKEKELRKRSHAEANMDHSSAEPSSSKDHEKKRARKRCHEEIKADCLDARTETSSSQDHKKERARKRCREEDEMDRTGSRTEVSSSKDRTRKRARTHCPEETDLDTSSLRAKLSPQGVMKKQTQKRRREEEDCADSNPTTEKPERPVKRVRFLVPESTVEISPAPTLLDMEEPEQNSTPVKRSWFPSFSSLARFFSFQGNDQASA